MSKLRVRFAPSPTGFLHIGSLRTVLFNYVLAKSKKGKFILRIEDTDQKRKVPGAVESLIEILDWLGFKFDEGPYFQSQRVAIYKKHIDKLLAKNKAYHCFCTPERLKKTREDQQADKKPPRYDRLCRDLPREEVKQKIKQGTLFVIRQKMPREGSAVAFDELRGEIKFSSNDLEDHVLFKSDGMPTYHLASVVDDHEMKISHVLRGDEWLSSFPKHILLYQDFNWTPPKFIHMPLTLNKEGGKLSKRAGDVVVEDFRQKGYLPEALINFSVLLGWHPKDDNEILTLDQVIKGFKIEEMGTSPAIFDTGKLDYLNGYYIRNKPLGELTKLCLPYLKKAGLVDKGTNKVFTKKVIAVLQERLKILSEVVELSDFFFEEKIKYKKELLAWKKMNNDQVKNNLTILSAQLKKIQEKNWIRGELEREIVGFIKKENIKVGEMLWPMRVALTGREASPGPFEVAEILGKTKTLKRIELAISKF